ncbi:MAG: phosphoribosylanthranilate isomerase [Actinomycetes bacterium]
MFVKICGITNEEDALMAVALGADALGFVFAASARQVTVGTVRDIVRRLPPDVVTIGVFRDHAPQRVIDVVLEAGLSGAQLHGHETPEDAAKIRPYAQVLLVAFAAGDPGLAHAASYGADAVLVDSVSPGSGEVFDWSMVEGIPEVSKLVLAGGLTPDNVAEAIPEVRPWGVDVSTGVELIEHNESIGRPSLPRKDPRKVQAFIRAARAAAPATYEPLVDGPYDWDESGS